MNQHVYNSANKTNGKKRKQPVPAIFTFRLDPELKRLLGEKADEEGLPLNEMMAQMLAESLGRPELGKIPRKSLGRPRKEIPAVI